MDLEVRQGPFLRPKEVAVLLGIGRRRVYQLTVAERRVPFIRRGRSILIPRDAFDAWLAAQSAQAMATLREIKSDAEGHNAD